MRDIEGIAAARASGGQRVWQRDSHAQRNGITEGLPVHAKSKVVEGCMRQPVEAIATVQRFLHGLARPAEQLL
jgi:hypothetical protein